MKKISIFLLTIICTFILISCNNNNNSTPLPNETIDGYTFEGTRTVGPYTVYTPDGSVYQSQFGEEANPNVSLYNAIRLASKKSTSKNKYIVKDSNGVLCFERQSLDKCWCYDGTYVVGIKSIKEAEAWSADRKRSYVVSGSGNGYKYLGATYYENSDRSQNIPLEWHSGGYNYMFSNAGISSGDTWSELGFGYMETTCRLSEASYRPSDDGSAWNAYIFINGAGGLSCDLGLIGGLRGDKVVWSLVRNCQNEDHKSTGDSFALPNSWREITSMTYDAEKDCYTGADDLFFQVWQHKDGWTLKITNLRTNQAHTLEEHHTDMFAGKQQYFRYLLAASYCPADDPTVWDGRCGAYLRNVVFDGIKIARYDESRDGINYLTEANPYTSDLFEDFNPTSNMNYGFSQGADCASAKYGTYTEGGTYKSGNTYEAGDYYMSYSCYYDGGTH